MFNILKKKIVKIIQYRRTPFYVSLILILLPFIFFYPILSHHFVSDDYIWLAWAQQLDFNWSSLWNIFTNSDFHQNDFYRPLTLISFLIDFKIAGLQPAFYYFNTLLFNGLNVGLFFYLTYLLIKGKRSTKLIGGIVASLVFLLLPVHTDNLMWIAGRTDVLATTFALLALITLLRYRKQAHKYWPGAFLIFILILATVLTKEIVGATLIAVMFLFDFTHLSIHKLKKIRYWSLYFFMITPGLIYLYLRWNIYGLGGLNVIASEHTITENTLRYLKWLAFPFLEYPWISIIALGLLGVTLIYIFIKNKRLLFLSVVWFVISFVLIQVASGSVSRWRLYFPSLALALVIGAGFAFIQNGHNKFIKIITAAALITILCTGLITLRKEIKEWRLVGDIGHVEFTTLVDNAEQLSCYPYILIINEANNLTTHSPLATFGGKHIVTKTIRNYALRLLLDQDVFERLPETMPVSGISIKQRNDPRAEAVFQDERTVDVTAGYVTVLKEEGVFTSERISRTAGSLTNRVTLVEGLTFADVGLFEYRDGIYYNYSDPCPLN